MRKRTDANQTAVVAAFRRCGFAVHDTSQYGQGFPDLVAYRPRNGVLLVEVKDGAKSPSRRKLTQPEREFAKQFPVVIVHSVNDVLRLANPDNYDIPRVDIA